MIPNFDDAPVKFTEFIQANKDIFDELIKKKNLTDGFNRNYIHQGYSFFINFNLSDDADVYSLIEDLDEFNTGGKGEIKIQKLINAVNDWLNNSKVKQEFKNEFNKKFKQELSNKLEEFKEKGEPMRRTQERTSLLQEEIFGAPYVPENRTDSVIGKKYRTLNEDFNRRNLGENLGENLGGKKKNKTKKNKTKKCRKSRRYMRSKK